eukprot:274428-Chlamydomonas_euryale.AAC.6
MFRGSGEGREARCDACQWLVFTRPPEIPRRDRRGDKLSAGYIPHHDAARFTGREVCVRVRASSGYGVVDSAARATAGGQPC